MAIQLVVWFVIYSAKTRKVTVTEMTKRQFAMHFILSIVFTATTESTATKSAEIIWTLFDHLTMISIVCLNQI